jgi:hypothetical protein
LLRHLEPAEVVAVFDQCLPGGRDHAAAVEATPDNPVHGGQLSTARGVTAAAPTCCRAPELAGLADARERR